MSVSNQANIAYRKGLINLEFEKKKEFDRRRKLRLLQVRERSNEFASEIRRNVETESKLLRSRALEIAAREAEKKRIDEINILKEKYQKCLQKIGESHLEALNQPNIALIKEAETARNKTAAALRAAKASRLLMEQQALHRETTEAPIKHKKITRMKENIRSGYICSLPKPSELPLRLPAESCQDLQTESRQMAKAPLVVLQEIPSNVLPTTAAKPVKPSQTTYMTPAKPPQPTTRIDVRGDEVIHKSIDDRKPQPAAQRTQAPPGVFGDGSANDCACDYYVCFCHESPKSLRRCSSESNVNLSGLEEEKESPTKRKSRSRSCSPYGSRSVRTLNYREAGNLYESSQPSRARVTYHALSDKPEQQKIETTLKPQSSGKKFSKEVLKRRTDIRSERALHREQVRGRFKKLLEDLETLGRNRRLQRQALWSKNGVFERERDIVAKNDAKKKKLEDAFETVLQSKEPKKTKTTGYSIQIQEYTPEVTSPPTLNLASYQENHTSTSNSKPTVSYDDVEILQSSTPASPSQTTSGLRSSSKTSPTRTRRSLSPKQPTGSSCLSTIITQDGSATTAPSSNLEVVVDVNDVNKKPPSDSPTITEKISSVLPDPIVINKTKENPSKSHKKKCKKKHAVSHLDSSTSYYSPPENVSPSQKYILNAIVSKLNQKEINADVRKYIYRLLSMSRYSIDNLNASSSSSECLDTARESMERETEEDLAKLSELTELYVDRFNTLVEMFEQVRPPESPVRFLSPPHVQIPSQYAHAVNVASASQGTQLNTEGPSTSRASHSRKEPSPIRRLPRKSLSPLSSSSSSDSSIDSTVRKTIRRNPKMAINQEPIRQFYAKTSSVPAINNLDLQTADINIVRSCPNSIASSGSPDIETLQTLIPQEPLIANKKETEALNELSPFIGMLNLLPHPEEVFRQQAPALSSTSICSSQEIQVDNQYQLGCGDGSLTAPLEDKESEEKRDSHFPGVEIVRKDISFDKNANAKPFAVNLISKIRERLNKVSREQFGEALPTLVHDNTGNDQDLNQSIQEISNPSLHLNAGVDSTNKMDPAADSPKRDSEISSALSIKSSMSSLNDVDVNKSITLNIVLDNLRKDSKKSDDSDSYIQTNFEAIDW